jgi:outer membrane protein assembly factor BamB
MKTLRNLLIIAGVILTLVQCQNKSENSQWRGNNRDGIYTETGLLTEWPQDGPELLWSADSIPAGFSSISVANGLIYTTGLRDSMDILFAVDMQGNIKWEVPYGKGWTQSFPPSRCTPVVEGEKVYVTSGTGHVGCFNALTGEKIWLFNASEKFEGTFGDWGISESPLIVDDKLIFSPGGKKTTMVALNKDTGETVWQTESLDDTPAYASPIIATINDTKVIINVLSTNLLGVNAETGKILFHTDYASISNEKAVLVWPGAPYTNTNNPIYKDHHIYLTSGYNHVGVMFELAQDLSKAEVKWIDSTLDVHHGGAVLIDNHIYGSNWINNRNGNWCCIDWETGKTMYETEWETKGSIISAEGKLYCYDEKDGNVALVNATPEGFNIISSFKVPLGKGPHWSHPVIKDGVLYIKHMDALMAFNIKKS